MRYLSKKILIPNLTFKYYCAIAALTYFNMLRALLFVLFNLRIGIHTLILTLAISCNPTKATIKNLNWHDRPDSIKKQIQINHENLQLRPEKYTNARLTEQNNVWEFDELQLIKKIILENQQTTDFYVMNIGALDFTWEEKLIKFMDESVDIPNITKITIISILPIKESKKVNNPNSNRSLLKLAYDRQMLEAPHRRTGAYPSVREDSRSGVTTQLSSKVEFSQRSNEKCLLKVHYGVNIDDIHEFITKQKHQIPFVHFIRSYGCFKHLVDPMGTFLQVYDFLLPKTGLIAMDGFFFMPEDIENYQDIAGYKNNLIRTFLNISEIQFLLYNTNAPADFSRFIVRKSDNALCHIPLEYEDNQKTLPFLSGISIASNFITAFKDNTTPSDIKQYPPLAPNSVDGEEELYKWMKPLHNKALNYYKE